MKERDLDAASEAQWREKQEKTLREAVARQWRAGLSDYRIGLVLGVKARRVRKVREALGLQANGRHS